MFKKIINWFASLFCCFSSRKPKKQHPAPSSSATHLPLGTKIDLKLTAEQKERIRQRAQYKELVKDVTARHQCYLAKRQDQFVQKPKKQKKHVVFSMFLEEFDIPSRKSKAYKKEQKRVKKYLKKERKQKKQRKLYAKKTRQAKQQFFTQPARASKPYFDGKTTRLAAALRR